MGFHLPYGGQLVTQALVDASFMFLQASKENIERSMQIGGSIALFLVRRVILNVCDGEGQRLHEDQFIAIWGIHWVLTLQMCN